jgi:hypothetical protein
VHDYSAKENPCQPGHKHPKNDKIVQFGKHDPLLCQSEFLRYCWAEDWGVFVVWQFQFMP